MSSTKSTAHEVNIPANAILQAGQSREGMGSDGMDESWLEVEQLLLAPSFYPIESLKAFHTACAVSVRPVSYCLPIHVLV